MSDVFAFHQGSIQLLVSVPHDGRRLPGDLQHRMTDAGRDIPDTDWHVAELYSFVRDMGASMIVADYSRYVIDLNRSSTDEALYAGQWVTGLCPMQTFAGHEIYVDGETIDDADRAQRIERYWRPYHDKIAAALEELRDEHGHALLWDAHSIPSEVPRLFAGELPVLNLGTNDDRSCDKRITDEIMRVVEDSPYSFVRNGRFKGGFITRTYGKQNRNVQAMQLELAQRSYMDEATRRVDAVKAAKLRDTLRRVLETYVTVATRSPT